MIRDDRI